MSDSDTTQNFDSSSIAIIGMAGRFPQANNLEEFWQNLRNGVESIVSLSEEEMEAAGMPQRLIKHPRFVKAGAIIEGEDLFDAPFFGYNPREAEALDPQHRLFLECAWEALENAGYDPEIYPGSIGVFAGSGVSGYLLRIFSSDKLLQIVGAHQALIANVNDFLATRVSYKANLKGPSLDVQTACSTSLVAVHLACQSIIHGECVMALAGGVTIYTPQKTGYLYREGGINSPDGRCRAFDAAAQGMIGGNGLGIVVLKRLEDALADNDSIYAVIRGSAVNNDGSLKAGFTAPSVKGQAEVIAEAQAIAGVEPETISYVEAHGTATPLGDPIEIEALAQAFRAGTDRKNFCAIGSVKTNIGHLGAAAGVAGLIKTALALKHGQIPPSLNFEKPNPKIDFENSPFYVNVKLRDWERNGYPRRAGVSSFGIGGTNAHVVVEEAPEIEPTTPSRPAQLLVLSARTDMALERATANLIAHLRRRPDADLADVAFTLQVGRRSFPHRRATVCSSVEEAVTALETLDPKNVFTLNAGSRKSQVAFMFSGQGAQYVNMGLGLYLAEPEFRRQVDLCAQMLEPQLGLDLRQLLYPPEDRSEEVAQRLRQTHITQPALFVIEYAMARMWMSWGVTPQAMIGHSVGEYVAACLAGVFSLEDALALIVLRGRLMQEMPEGAMLAIPLPVEEVRPLLNDRLSLAAVNAPSLCVVSGPKDVIGELQRHYLAGGLECRLLHTSHAFHSSMMEPAVERFVEQVRKVKLNRPALPYISNLTGTWVTEAQAIDPAYWGAHLRHPVLFAQGAQELLQQPDIVLLEVGPGQTLASLVRQQGQAAPARSVIASLRRPDERQDDLAFLLSALGRLWMAGVKVDWKGFYLHERRRRVALPTYPFERQRYWLEGRGLSMEGYEEISESLYKKPDIADWFYEPMWKRSGHLSIPEPAELAGQKMSYLVFLDNCGLGAAIVERLRDYGQEVITVSTGDVLDKSSERAYAINPRRKEDYDGLLRELGASGAIPGVIVNLWGVTPHGVPAQTGEPKESEELGFYSLFYLTQAVGKRSLTDQLRIIVVSNEAQDVTGEENTCPEKALVLGLCRVVPQEYLNITCRSVDVSSSRFEPQWDEALVRALVAEVMVANSDLNVAYRGKRRWVEIFEPLRMRGGEVSQNSLLREGGVYLITGGLGRVGLALAAHLARTVKAKLVLLGRTPAPPRDEWEKSLAARPEADETRLRALLGLESEGAEVLLVTADVADERQMREAVSLVYERFGALHGVIHGAAGKTVAAIQEMTAAECEAQFRAKVGGLRVLEEVLRGANLDFCLLLSSVASILGGLGYGAYSAASNFMDAFARRQNLVNSFPWISVDMDGWRFGDGREQGPTIGATLAELAMTQAEGVEAIQRILSGDVRSQVIISTGDLNARIDQWVKLESSRERGGSETDEAISLHQRPEMATVYVAPADETERAIADIWRRLLGIEQIGVQDNFFELGGHSLLATQIVSQMRKVFRAEIPLRRMLETPTVAGLAQGLRETIENRRGAQPMTIAPVPRDRRLPLSFAQQRLWFLHRMEPDNPVYNQSKAFRLVGDLDVGAVARSLNEVVRRHEVLRTTIAEVDGQPVQVIAPELALTLQMKDLTKLAEADREGEVRRLADEEARRPFDLSCGPLLRGALLRVAENEHVMLFAMHHIVSDGWSMALLVQEVTALYQAFSQGKPSPLAELNVQYADFAVWQREWMQGEVLHEHLAYWRERLGGDLPALELPIDRPRPATQSHRGEIEYLALSKEISEAAGGLSRREGVTTFMFLLAVFKAVLHRYTGQSDILVGAPSANRTRAETESLIGFFINTLVLRTHVTGELSFLELLREVREVTLGAYARQDLPFDTLVMELQPDRSLNHMPLFQVAFNIYNFPTPTLELPEIKLVPINSDSGAMPYDLNLTARDGEDGMLLGLGYNTDIFDGSTIKRMLAHFRAFLEAVVADPSQRLRDTPLLGAEERRMTLLDWNDTRAYFSGPCALHQIFEEQVGRAPASIAVQFDDHQITYAELDDQADLLASRLRSLGVGPETRVGVFCERSIELVVALLGVLKAGGVYVPLDTAYPQERLAFIIEDSQLSVLLVQRRHATSLSGYRAQVVCVDDGQRVDRGQRFESAVSPENLAYVIYTSGSTGTPKGVMVSHGSIRNRLLWMLHDYPFTPDDILLQKTVFTFDASVWELFAPLFAGARLVLARPDGHRDSAYMAEAIRRERVTILQMAPSLLRVFLREEEIERCESLRHVFCGGEELKAEDRSLFFSRSKARLHNLYGPTEVSIDATHWECERDEDAGLPPPIGRPLSNVQTYILDNYMQPVSAGAPGELHVGGAGLARGYLNRPDLTAEKFIPNPFSSSPGAELYKTGDLARYLPDGRIAYLGRIDHQVKLRGYRIELNEIEGAICQHPSVSQAVVVVREDEPDQRRLVAYVVEKRSQAPGSPEAIHPSRGSERSEDAQNGRHKGALEGLVAPALDENELRRFLEAKLPEYMTPSAIVFLNELPVTPGGKLSRRALPPPDHLEVGDAETFVRPQTPTEELVAGIWRAVLRLEHVGRKSNFFDLGGHSLLAMQLMSRVRKVFKADLKVRTLFESPTVESLSAAIDEAVSGVGRVTRSAGASVQSPLSFAQRRRWSQDQSDKRDSAHNFPIAVRLGGRLDVPILEQSLNEVVERQWVLRTTFLTVGEQPAQCVISARPLKLRIMDLSDSPQAEREAEARRLAEEEWDRPFDLANDLLLRAFLIKLSTQEHLLLLTTPRIIADEWSRDILVNDIAAMYEGRSKGRSSAPRLTELPIQYADFAAWQKERTQDGEFAKQFDYWRQRLDGAPALALPTDRTRPVDATSMRVRHSLALPADLKDALRTLSLNERVTMFMVSLATFQTLLSYYTGQQDIVVGTEDSNRNRAETRGLLGPLANQLAIRADLSGDPSFLELLDRVREAVLGAYANRDLPFEQLIEELNPEWGQSQAPLIRAKLVHSTLATRTIKAAGLRFETLPPSAGRIIDPAHLLLNITELEGGLLCELFYSADLFSRGAVERLLGRFHALLCQVVAQPEAPLSALTSVFAEADKQRRFEEEQALEQVGLRTLKGARRKSVSKLKATGD